jgi:PAS domain S-box-containing protein
MQRKFDVSVKQLYLLIFITAASLTGLGLYGINGYKKLNENTRTLYADRVVCMRQLANMRFQYAGEIVPAALSVKHHLLTFDAARQRVRNARLIIDSNWHNYRLTYLTPEEDLLARQTDTLKNRVDEEIKNLESILLKKDTAAITSLVINQPPAVQMPFSIKLTQLMDLQERVGKQIFENSRHTYAAASKNFIFWIFFSLLFAVSLSLLIIKNIRRLISDILTSHDIIESSEHKYRSILENASDAIYLVDNKRRFIEANDTMCKMIGYAKDELLQLKIEDIFDNEQLKTDPVDLSLIPYHSTFKQKRFIRKDGTAVEVEIHGRRLDESNWIGVARDITERKKMETELREAELKFRTK